MTDELEVQEPLDPEKGAEPIAPVLFDEEDQESEPVEPVEGEQPEGSHEADGEAGRPAPVWAHQLRKEKKSLAKEKFRLEKENAELRAKLAPPAPVLTAKPTLDQFDYDETRFSEAYDKWMEQKEAMNRADQAKLDAQRVEQESLQSFQKSYSARKESLGVDDFEEAEAEVAAILTPTQQGLLMRAPDDPAHLVYALGKSNVKLIELAKISDPVKFAAAVVKMEIQLATKKTTRPAPEPRMSAERTSSGFNASGAALEKLRDEAARTGDFTKVVEYKRKLAQGK